MKNTLLALTILAVASSNTLAAQPTLKYPDLLRIIQTEKGDVNVRKKTVRRVVDLQVNQVEGGTAYMVNPEDEVMFFCGDNGVPGFSAGQIVGTVIGYQTNNPNSYPVFTLANCKASASAKPAATASQAKSLYFHSGDPKMKPNGVVKSSVQTLTGIIDPTMDDDNNNVYDFVLPNKKRVFITLQYANGDALADFLLEGMDKGTVSVTGTVVTLRNGKERFDLTKPITFVK